MPTPLTVIDDYHLSIIEPAVARFLSPVPVVEEVTEDEPDDEVKAKVVRRGRPAKPKVNEGAETK